MDGRKKEERETRLGEKEREKKIERKAGRKRAMSGMARRIKGWERERDRDRERDRGSREIEK